MKKDIQNRADIELLIDNFYKKAENTKVLGVIFKEMTKVSWLNNLTAVYNFWENIILYTGAYEGQLIDLHKYFRHGKLLRKFHFDLWDQLFICTVDELFEGEKANLAKQRAISMSCIIRMKISAYQQKRRKIKRISLRLTRNRRR